MPQNFPGSNQTGAALPTALPQHTVDLVPPPNTVKRKASMADMLMRLTTHTASTRGKIRDAQPTSPAPPRSLKTSQSMYSLRTGSAPAAGGGTGATRAHTRTLSNPGSMPPISRPIAVPVAFPPAGRLPSTGADAARLTGSYSPPTRSTGSNASSLLSDGSFGSARSVDSPTSGTPRRPAPLPPSQAMVAQPRTKRGPGTLVSPQQHPAAGRRPTPSMPGAPANIPSAAGSRRAIRETRVPSGARSPEPAAGSESQPLSVAKTRKTPKKSPRSGRDKPSPEYVKRSPGVPTADQSGAVGLGLDLGAGPAWERVASAPAPPAGFNVTRPRSMQQNMQQNIQQNIQQNTQQSTQQSTQQDTQKNVPQLQQVQQRVPTDQHEGDVPQPPQHRSATGPQNRSATGPQNRSASGAQARSASSAQNRSTQNRSASSSQQQQQQSRQQQQQQQSQRAQQMRDRVTELQSLTKPPASSPRSASAPKPTSSGATPAKASKSSGAPQAASVRTPVMQQTGFESTSPSPGISPLKTPRMGHRNAARSPSHDHAQELLATRQQLSRLEIKYNVLKEQREHDALNLQSISAELSIAQASRDSLQQQVAAYQQAQQDMQRRVDSLQRTVTRSQRLVRVLGANLEDSKVALEEKNMENYALKRRLSRFSRPKQHGRQNDEGMLSPPNSISDAAEIDQDSDTPTIRG